MWWRLSILLTDGSHTSTADARLPDPESQSQQCVGLNRTNRSDCPQCSGVGSLKSEDESDRQTTAPKSAVSAASTLYPKAKIGKITASFGDPDPPYEDAILSHETHNALHGYPQFILRERILRGLWSKHLWIMTVIGQELAKPEDLRLNWLLWHDRDTVLMNPQIALDIFLPPEPQFSNIHLIATNDHNGLNNGVFFVRVSPWAFKLFASALSIPEYQPEIPLKYSEQSAMEEAIKRPWWKERVVQVPQRWFNCYPPKGKPSEESAPSICREGSMLIHFASNRDGKRPERMARFHEIANQKNAEWYKPINETGYMNEIGEYWGRLAQGEDQEEIVEDLGKRTWNAKEHEHTSREIF
ncbi:glycosyltransferase family 34 protein [Amniculicola lignicola CBS 123094]|uniref:Glycosyltransferase family 34 protein n=1 Tax=Amniculicola lignicola CBS 123094 TaxID=1392246 RepID=A0A6A5W5W6_9PLEO|nr:glycosyltransferase family 34 protein [Amniculicola lignicola CBS 123094]